MNKYLEHPPVEAPFWDISNKLKYFGSSKGEFIDYKFAVEMSLRIRGSCGAGEMVDGRWVVMILLIFDTSVY